MIADGTASVVDLLYVDGLFYSKIYFHLRSHSDRETSMLNVKVVVGGERVSRCQKLRRALKNGTKTKRRKDKA